MKNANRHLACGTCILALLVGLVATPSAQAQTYKVLYSFQCGPNDGASPLAGVVLDTNGNLYGTTNNGGPLGFGVAYELTVAGTETVLYDFPDYEQPSTNLVHDTLGNLYGTTGADGLASGMIFRLSPAGKVTVLSNTGDASALLLYAANFYFTIPIGGDVSCNRFGCGTVFKLDTTGKLTNLHTFTGLDGAWPEASLIKDPSGNLYSTAVYGGSGLCTNNGTPAGCGVVFTLNPAGQESVLHSFTGSPDGAYPVDPLVRDSAGDFFGTTSSGGTYGGGTVFKIDPAGVETVLYSFTGGTDGSGPYGGLLLDAKGTLYGETAGGGSKRCYPGSSTCGVVFELSSAGVETVLHNFAGKPKDGQTPLGGLIADTAGNLYGTTQLGGAFGCGTVFKLGP